jgi:hypothetical protein
MKTKLMYISIGCVSLFMIGKYLCKKYFINKKKEEKIEFVDSDTYYSYYENSESNNDTETEVESLDLTNSISDIISTSELYTIPLTDTEIESDIDKESVTESVTESD